MRWFCSSPVHHCQGGRGWTGSTKCDKSASDADTARQRPDQVAGSEFFVSGDRHQLPRPADPVGDGARAAGRISHLSATATTPVSFAPHSVRASSTALVYQPQPMVLDGCPMFAPAYMGRKWFFFQCFLLLHKYAVLGNGRFARIPRTFEGAAPPSFQPMYAGANIDWHPSREVGLVACAAAADDGLPWGGGPWHGWRRMDSATIPRSPSPPALLAYKRSWQSRRASDRRREPHTPGRQSLCT